MRATMINLISSFLVLLFLVFTTPALEAQEMYFPPLTGDSWDTLSLESLGWCSDKADILIDYLESRNTKAFILLKNGKIIIEKYFGTFTQDSAWYWASAGKTLTAFIVGIAQEEGYLSIHDTTSTYLGNGWTSCTPAQEEKITIWHQLTMTSGLDDEVPDNFCTLDTCLIYLADAGTRWAYHNAPYTLLDQVIQSATGQTLNYYLTAKVKNPTGMTGAFIPLGYNNVYFSKPRSMARFGLLVLNQGNWAGNQIMSDTNYFNQMVNTSQSMNEAYGYLWWLNGKETFMVPTLQYVFSGPLVPHAPNDMIAALGLNGQMIHVVPGQQLVLIRMGHAPYENQEITIHFADTIWQKLNDVMCSSSSVDQLKIGKISIYPNPATNTISISFNDINPQKVELTIYNMFGQAVMTEAILNSTSMKTLDISNLPNGIYFINGQFHNQAVFRKKLVVFR